MFELIVLGLILAGLAAIARAPAEKPTVLARSTRPIASSWLPAMFFYLYTFCIYLTLFIQGISVGPV